MKKYLIGFGVLGIFFAGFHTANAEWEPRYIADKTYKDCKNEEGEWINVPIKKAPSGKCLQIEKKGENAGACDALDFDITMSDTKTGKRLPIVFKNKKYVISSKEDITCSGKKCSLTGFEDIEVKCYQTDSFAKLVDAAFLKDTTNDYTTEKHCVVNESDLRIKGIDSPEESIPEWYCPYNWSGQYPEDANPYNVDGSYFKSSLKSVYHEFIPEENSELIHDCSRRMFALAKSCANRVEIGASRADKIRKIRGNFYSKKAVELWRGDMITAKGIEAYSQWQEIKDMSFKDICKLDKGSCSPSVYQDEKGRDKVSTKTDAIKAVHKWLESHTDLRENNQNPAKYFKELAQNEWDKDSLKANDVKDLLKKDVKTIWGERPAKEKELNKLKNYMGGVYNDKDGDFKFGDLTWEGKDSAKEKFKKLLITANEKNYASTLISKYISRRNNDLNVAVSVNQTSHIKVSKLLRAYGNEDNGSKEADLAIFNDKRGEKPLINVFDKIIRLAVRTMGTLAIFLLIISGVLMVVSQGDDNQLEQAKTVFIYTLLGLIIGFLSYTIVRFVIDTLLS